MLVQRTATQAAKHRPITRQGTISTQHMSQHQGLPIVKWQQYHAPNMSGECGIAAQSSGHHQCSRHPHRNNLCACMP
jgi:hypothetical protein